MMPLALVRLTAHGQRVAQGGGTPAWDMGGHPWGTVPSTAVHPTRFNLNAPSFSFFGSFYKTRSSESVSRVVVNSRVSDILANKCPLLSPWDKCMDRGLGVIIPVRSFNRRNQPSYVFSQAS